MKHALFSFYIAGALSTGAGMTLHVSPGGADTNPGTEDRPFATLVRARDEIRTLKKDGRLPNDGVTVLLAPGRYALAEPLELTAEDSGADSAPVVYRAWEHGTVVKFDAGVTPMLLIEPRISRPELKPRYIMEELAGRPFAADGIADPQEWPKTNKVPLECVNKLFGAPSKFMASARIGFDGERLRFFVTIDVDPQKPLRTEGGWGSRDGLELAFSDTGDDAPIFLLHAYPDGSIEVTGADSAAAEHCQALQKHCCMAHCSEL